MSASYTLITGASSGIGQAVACRLSSSRNLILGGRDEERLLRTQTLCCDSDRHLRWNFDLRQTETLSGALADLLSVNSATVDCFVHCAGVTKVGPARLMNLQAVQEVFSVNLFSATEIVRVLLSRKVNFGALRSVLFISSIYAQRGAKGSSIYSASKGGIEALMRSLAVELAPAIRVNCIAPGAVRTPMAATTFEDSEMAEKLRQEYPLGFGDAADIGEAVEFLLSDRARWICGQVLTVDGGRAAS
jgi:NAD(P)-dependent dehydrogenase (short-subunit alcohol dehydrogenase family)